MMIKYYDGTSTRLQYGITFLILSTTLIYSIWTQLKSPLQYDLLWSSFSLVPLWLISTFFFLKCIMQPRLQISYDEIILTGFKRKTIPLKDVKELSLSKNYVFIAYNDNGIVRKTDFSISPPKEKPHMYIYNGKISEI